MTFKVTNPEGYMATVRDAALKAGLESVEGLDAGLDKWFRCEDERHEQGTFYLLADAIAAYLEVVKKNNIKEPQHEVTATV